MIFCKEFFITRPQAWAVVYTVPCTIFALVHTIAQLHRQGPLSEHNVTNIDADSFQGQESQLHRQGPLSEHNVTNIDADSFQGQESPGGLPFNIPDWFVEAFEIFQVAVFVLNLLAFVYSYIGKRSLQKKDVSTYVNTNQDTRKDVSTYVNTNQDTRNNDQLLALMKAVQQELLQVETELFTLREEAVNNEQLIQSLKKNRINIYI